MGRAEVRGLMTRPEAAEFFAAALQVKDLVQSGKLDQIFTEVGRTFEGLGMQAATPAMLAPIGRRIGQGLFCKEAA